MHYASQYASMTDIHYETLQKVFNEEKMSSNYKTETEKRNGDECMALSSFEYVERDWWIITLVILMAISVWVVATLAEFFFQFAEHFID